MPIGGAQKLPVPSSLILNRPHQVVTDLPAGARVRAILWRAIDQVTEAMGGLEPRLAMIARKRWTGRPRLSGARGKQDIPANQNDRKQNDGDNLLRGDLHSDTLS